METLLKDERQDNQKFTTTLQDQSSLQNPRNKEEGVLDSPAMLWRSQNNLRIMGS